jgi:hypothetical protein
MTLNLARFPGAETGAIIGEVPGLVPSGTGRTGTNGDKIRLSVSPDGQNRCDVKHCLVMH